MNSLATGIFWLTSVFIFPLIVYSNATNAAPVNAPLHGDWWLLNPEALQPDLIAGALIICKKEGDDICNGKDMMLVLLEKNTGHGCTDYIAYGAVKENAPKKQWQLYLGQEDTQTEVWATTIQDGNHLTLKLAEGDIPLKLEKSDPDAIDKKTHLGVALFLRRTLEYQSSIIPLPRTPSVK